MVKAPGAGNSLQTPGILMDNKGRMGAVQILSRHQTEQHTRANQTGCQAACRLSGESGRSFLSNPHRIKDRGSQTIFCTC